MADNTQITPGIGETVATDDIGSVKYQRVKLIHGADGVNDGDVSTANPYPVKLAANSGVDIGDVDVASIADGVDVTQGALADAAIISDAAGTVSAKLRGLVTILADIWDSVNNLIRTSVTNLIGITSLGQSNKAGSIPVTLASDEDAVALAANSGVDIGDVDVTSIAGPIANCTEVVPTQITKTVAAIATPEALAANDTLFRRATLLGKKAARTNNAGIVYLGIGATNDTQALEINPGETVTIEAPVGCKYDLNDWYLDVLNAGDGVVVIYS